MAKERLTPCASCPYRKDARLAFWHRQHFEKLLADDAKPFGPLYQCHEDRKKPAETRGLCVGWMLDQKRRNVPSILLRLRLMTKPEAGEMFARLTSGGATMFRSVDAMCRANLRAIARGARGTKRKEGK